MGIRVNKFKTGEFTETLDLVSFATVARSDLEAKIALRLVAAEQWALYVVEDSAPCTLVDYLKEAIK